MTDIRRTLMVGSEIILATGRDLRPNHFLPKDGEESPCPFCPGNEHLAPDPQLEWKDDRRRWKLRVIPNKFPAVRVEGNSTFLVDSTGFGIADAHGVHDILVETPRHDATHATLSVAEHQDILWAIRNRTNDLRGDTRLHYLVVFKNFGLAAGASLPHPHTQIIGLPFIPAKLLERWNRLEKDYYQHGVSCFARALQKARIEKLVVLENDRFICYCPYESRVPFEMWILPNDNIAHFDDLSASYGQLASMLAKTFHLLELAVGFLPPFNLFLDEGPTKQHRNCDRFYRVRIRIVPRLTCMAGFEFATGCFINSVPPEQAAKRLREVDATAAFTAATPAAVPVA
ncbi:MAG: DUF4921 family protein [Patescibacteria group bacterium]|nr:DUF4921 family protein [Patescibacteria group bacterium]